MLALLRRAGAGWIAATYDRKCRNIDLFAGEWSEVRDVTLRVVGALALSPALELSPASTLGVRPAPVLASIVWTRPRSGDELLDAAEPEHRTRV